MKRLYFVWMFAALSGLAIIYACNKNFLDKQPQGAFNPAVLANRPGVEGLLIGAYHMLSGQGGAAGNNWGNAASNWVFGSVVADDSYKGSTPSDQGDIVPIETWAYNTNNPYFNQKWQAVYDGVQRANDVLRVLPLATDIPDADKAVIAGEARFLRGHFHFEAKKMWNNVPYADETTTETSNVDEQGNYVDVWPQIEADFQFAVDNLPETQPHAGRANKSAAKAYLAKVYMFQSKYNQAKPILEDLIANGQTAKGEKYGLMNYEANFNAAQDNSKESVFAYQASVNDGSGTNGNYGDNLNFPNSGGPGGCCGFNNPSISLANAYKTDANGLPLFDTYNTGNNVSNPTSPYTGTLDPRIDWVIGRPGIPYFDWGPHPGPTWIRDPGTNGYFSPKKNIYAKSQQGTLSSTETAFWGPTQMDANNVNIIRFADILLWAAECEIEIGTGEKAREYVNLVRARAADPTGWVYDNSDYDANNGKYVTQTTPADNYNIGLYPAGAFNDKAYATKAIRFERRLELAMEGMRFFDLQRWDKGTGTVMAPELNAYATAEKTRPSIFAVNPGATFTANKNEYYPIPQTQIDIKNAAGEVKLKQNPGYN